MKVQLSFLIHWGWAGRGRRTLHSSECDGCLQVVNPPDLTRLSYGKIKPRKSDPWFKPNRSGVLVCRWSFLFSAVIVHHVGWARLIVKFGEEKEFSSGVYWQLFFSCFCPALEHEANIIFRIRWVYPTWSISCDCLLLSLGGGRATLLDHFDTKSCHLEIDQDIKLWAPNDSHRKIKRPIRGGESGGAHSRSPLTPALSAPTNEAQHRVTGVRS